MARVPFISRLNLLEYLALTLSFTLVLLETIVRSITLLLPSPVIRIFYRLSRNAFNSLSSPYSRRARNRKKAVSSPIAQAHDFVEICDLFGYYAEEHVVQTGDGYLLGLHRLGWKRGEEDQRVNNGPDSIRKKVVYLHHGLLMNSEVWVCITERERCLPFLLVEQGYDVWLGNNRGNKYSKKSVHSKPTQDRFWDFSMDQFAFHDIPDSINYILETTGQPSLSYIGFSQGTAQAFATLSIHPTLNNKVDVFVALAPAMAPPGLASGVVASLCKSNPEVLFLAFGRKAILASSTMWSALLYPAIFTWFIDKSINFLFGWKSQNITPHQKLAAYPHLYSFTSTKCVVHWFQIIRNGTFQMYDDEVTTPLAVGNGSKYYKVAKFPTRNIKTPIVLVYGGSDSLVDIKLMLKELPRHTVARSIPKYEHLDLLWASDVDKLVFPHVLEALDSYAKPEQTKTAALGWPTGVHRPSVAGLLDRASPAGSLPPGYSEDERDRTVTIHSSRLNTNSVDDFDFGDFGQPSVTGEHEQLDETDDEDTADERVGNGVFGAMADAFGTAPGRPKDHQDTVRTPPSIFHSNNRPPLPQPRPFPSTTREAHSPPSVTSSSARTAIPIPSSINTKEKAHPSSSSSSSRRIISPRLGVERQTTEHSKQILQQQQDFQQQQRRRERRGLVGERDAEEEATVRAAGSEDAGAEGEGRRNPEGWWSSATSTSGEEEAGGEEERERESGVPVALPEMGSARVRSGGGSSGRKRVRVDRDTEVDGR